MRITRTASRRKLFGALLCTLSLAACSPPPEGELPGEKSPEPGTQEQPVVYGDDHRTDVYAYPASALRDRAEKSTVALMSPSDINTSNPNDVTFNASPLRTAYNLCSDQRFLDDPTAAFCSGTLIDDDLVLTAGHCITSASACANTRFVFNYYRTSATALHTVTTADVFACASIVARQQSTVNGRNLDYAVVRLDRPATPRFEPAPIRPGNTALPLNTGVSVIGSGSGIPFKIDDGGWVRTNRASTLDYFVANTDTFGGNSGSGVYENNGFTVAGILVRGVTDYVSRGNCNVVNQCTDTGCGGESITYARPAIDAYCAVATSERLCEGYEPPPPPPPVETFTFTASNTNSAQQNTTNVNVTLAAGQTLTFGTCSLPQATGTGDTYLRLYNAATNTQVAANDDSCSLLSLVTFTASTAGQYQMRAGCYSTGSCSGTVAYTIQ
ncbi:trypsin-like serine peptidase [Myxococcus sp. 1LA]